MSTINVTNLKHASSGSNNIVLDSSGNATVAGTLANTGNLTITSGNLVLSSGNGIDFSATTNSSGTMTSELLADYEEGTWTPTVVGSTTAGTVSYYGRNARYTKIGRLVTCEAFVSWHSGTGSGNLRFEGLPYTVSSANTYPAACIGATSGVAVGTNQQIMGRAEPSTTQIRWQSSPTSGDSAENQIAYDAAGFIGFTISYTV